MEHSTYEKRNISNASDDTAVLDVLPDEIISDDVFAQNPPCAMFKGHNLRMVRRKRGLSQTELADLLGVTQPNVSRWEAGFEETPQRIRRLLKDILFTRNDQLRNYFMRLAQSDSQISVIQLNRYSLPIAKLADYVLKMLPAEEQNYVGEDYRRIFDTDWIDLLFQNRPITDFALVGVNYDLRPDKRFNPSYAVRAHSFIYIVQPEDGSPLLLENARYTAATGEAPMLSHAITKEEALV